MPRLSQPLCAVGGVALALLLSTGGVAGATSKARQAPPKAAASKTVAPTTFPKVKVIDLTTAKTVDLASLNVTTKPQLVWFWAPT